MPTMKTTMFIALSTALVVLGGSCRKPVVGCTDPDYANYDAEHNEDDGCCCNIVRAQDDSAKVFSSVFAHAFDDVPDTVLDMPVVVLRASCLRHHEKAEGPCGCLEWKYYGLVSEGEEYDPTQGVYGPRDYCYTSIGWWCRLGTEDEDTAAWEPGEHAYADTEDWNHIASINGFDPETPRMRITYTASFL